MRNEDRYVRRAAVRVLKECGVKERAPHIARVVELLRDADGGVRRAAAELLSECGSEERAPHLL